MTKKFRFTDYNPSELRGCGKAFASTALRRASEFDAIGSAAWTEFVLNWFADTARRNPTPCIDARPARDLKSRTTRGEFMLDLVHSTYPTYEKEDFYSMSYWSRALKGDLELLLALESEWGISASAEANVAAILEDAAKLAAVRARVKVMVYASTPRKRIKYDVAKLLSNLRTAAADEKPWLVIDVPWAPVPRGTAWTPTWIVFE